MDIPTLISMVYARPPLWNLQNKLRGDRNVIDKFWRQISLEMKQDESKLRKKWKYLRDQFSVELGKLPPDAKCRPKWVHFDSLLFLKEMVKPRERIKKPKKNYSRKRYSAASAMVSDDPGADSSVDYDDEDGHDDDDVDGHDDDSNSDHESLLQLLDKKEATSSSKRKNIGEDNGHGTVKKRKSFNHHDDDENLFFLKSLLPHIRKIPNNKILHFRNRVQEIVEGFAYRSEPEHVKFII